MEGEGRREEVEGGESVPGENPCLGEEGYISLRVDQTHLPSLPEWSTGLNFDLP